MSDTFGYHADIDPFDPENKGWSDPFPNTPTVGQPPVVERNELARVIEDAFPDKIWEHMLAQDWREIADAVLAAGFRLAQSRPAPADAGMVRSILMGWEATFEGLRSPEGKWGWEQFIDDVCDEVAALAQTRPATADAGMVAEVVLDQLRIGKYGMHTLMPPAEVERVVNATLDTITALAQTETP